MIFTMHVQNASCFQKQSPEAFIKSMSLKKFKKLQVNTVPESLFIEAAIWRPATLLKIETAAQEKLLRICTS